MIRLHFRWLLFSLLSTVFLAACSTRTAELPVKTSISINSGMSIGQTFTTNYEGLSRIFIMLGPSESAGSGNLLFHLRSSPQSIDDIASDRLPVSEVTQQAYYEFTVPPQSNSKRKDYFVSVELEGKGEVQIFTADADSYEDGALYKNQTPQESQLVFQLEYDRNTFLAGLAKQFAKWIGILAIGFFAFILPGWALFSLLWPSWNELSWRLKLGLSSGLSLAIYPLFLLWTDLIGLHLYFWYAWLPPLCGILILVWKNRKIFLEIRNSFQQTHRL